MAIETSFSIKQLNVDEALKLAEAKAKATAQNIDKTLNNNKPVDVKVKPFGQKVKDELEKVKKGIEAAGISGEKFGKIGDVFAAGKIAGAVALIAMAGKYIYEGVSKTWDRLHLSSEEYLAKEEKKAKEYKEKNDKQKKEQAEAQGYFDRLGELADQENLSNAAKQEAIVLIDLLTKKYGELGLSIDEATGEIKGFDHAQEAALIKNRQERIEGLTKERDSIGRQAATQSNLAVDKIARNPFSGWFEDIFKPFGLEKASTVGWRDDFQNMLNSGEPLDKQIKFFEIIRDRTNNQDEVDSVQKVIDLLKQKMELQNKINQLTDNGNETAEEYAKKLRDKTNKDKTAKYQSEASAEWAKERGINDNTDALKDAAAYDKLDTSAEQIAFKQGKVSEELEKQKNLQSAIDEIEKRKHTGEDAEAMRAADIAAIARLETEIAQSKQDQLKLEIDIDKIKRKSTEYYKDSKEKLDDDIEIQKQINAGKNEEAEKQKIINDLKAKGLEIDDAEVNKIMEKKKELAGLKFNDQMAQQGYDLLYKQQSKTNYKSAEYEKRVRDKERELGISLDDAQKEKIKQQIDLEVKVNNEPKLDFSGTEIKTNELTARGGFAGGAVMIDKDKVNTQIRDYNARQVNLLNQIKSVLEKGGVI